MEAGSDDGQQPYKYVYGVVPASAAAAISGSGIGGARLATVVSGDAAAVVSDVVDGEMTAGREELRVHSQVLEDALAQGTVLPMRFGVVLPGEEAVRIQLLEGHRHELARQLADLAGKLELRVRATYEESVLMAEVVAASPAIAELRRSLRGRPTDATYFERIRLGELVAEEINHLRRRDTDHALAVLTPFSEALHESEPAHERVAFDASFLVTRAAQDDFEQALEGAAEGQAGRLTFRLIGPLPPHSFVTVSARGGD